MRGDERRKHKPEVNLPVCFLVYGGKHLLGGEWKSNMSDPFYTSVKLDK